MAEDVKNKLVERAMFAPLSLFSVRDKELIRNIYEFIPYSTGFEIECNKKDNYDYKTFTSIPYLMSGPNQYDTGEFRFRIRPGIVGLINLFFITENAKKQLSLNPGSGIHYHVDLTDCWDIIESKGKENLVTEFNESGFAQELIDSLDSSVHYGGRYTKQLGIGKGYWMGLRDGHRTMEFRTGQMTFDYKEIAKCIISANQVIKKFKIKLLGEDKVKEIHEENFANEFKELNFESFSDHLKTLHNYTSIKSKIEKAKDELKKQYLERKNLKKPIDELEDINQLIKKRLS